MGVSCNRAAWALSRILIDPREYPLNRLLTSRLQLGMLIPIPKVMRAKVPKASSKLWFNKPRSKFPYVFHSHRL